MLASTLATLAPQYFLWRLIRILEQLEQEPHSSATRDPKTGMWLALLGLAQLVQPWVETWLLWVGWVHVALPIYVQLSGLIVEKSLRKKDVKEVRDGEEEGGILEVPDFERLDAARVGKKDGDKGIESTREKEKLAPKRMQGQINLISVDVQRVTDFLSYNGMLVSCCCCCCCCVTVESEVVYMITDHVSSQDYGNVIEYSDFVPLPAIVHEASFFGYCHLNFGPEC